MVNFLSGISSLFLPRICFCWVNGLKQILSGNSLANPRLRRLVHPIFLPSIFAQLIPSAEKVTSGISRSGGLILKFPIQRFTYEALGLV